MLDTTEAQSAPMSRLVASHNDRNARLSRLFTSYNDDLVRALQAKLGRRGRHLAEDLAAATWVRAVEGIQHCPADAESEVVWLSTLAQKAADEHFRLARQLNERPVDFSHRNARALPPTASAEDVVLDAIEDEFEGGFLLAGAMSVPAGVAA